MNSSEILLQYATCETLNIRLGKKLEISVLTELISRMTKVTITISRKHLWRRQSGLKWESKQIKKWILHSDHSNNHNSRPECFHFIKSRTFKIVYFWAPQKNWEKITISFSYNTKIRVNFSSDRFHTVWYTRHATRFNPPDWIFYRPLTLSYPKPGCMSREADCKSGLEALTKFGVAP